MLYNYSVIIPYRDTYNMLVKAIASIPDRRDIQIIIVDNSATPLSSNRMPTKVNAKVVSTTSSPTAGAGCARNVGLQKAKGRFLLFLDADDYYLPHAFASFDKYLESEYDIIFFDADSIRLTDGAKSDRHTKIHQYIESFIKDGDEKQLRYRFVNPVCKMIRASLVAGHNILFDEIRVSNDAMFSIMTGHYAKTVTASNDVVYMITEGEKGSSLTKVRTAENMYIRYQVAVRRYRFITENGPKEMKPRLIGYLRFALFHFGPRELFKYWNYARKNNVRFI